MGQRYLQQRALDKPSAPTIAAHELVGAGRHLSRCIGGRSPTPTPTATGWVTCAGYRTVAVGDATFAYLREDVLVALNLSEEPQTVLLGDLAGRVRLSTYLDGRGDEVHGELPLRPGEGVVICLCNA